MELLNEYDVVLVILTLFGFLITVCTAVWKLKGSISAAQSTADLLRGSIGELRQALQEFRQDNRTAHNGFYGRIRELESRVSVLESRIIDSEKEKRNE